MNGLIYCPKCETPCLRNPTYCSMCGYQLAATKVNTPPLPPGIPITWKKLSRWTMLFLAVGIPMIGLVVYSLLDGHYAWSYDRKASATYVDDQKREKAATAKREAQERAKDIEDKKKRDEAASPINEYKKLGVLTHIDPASSTARADVSFWLQLPVETKQGIVFQLHKYFESLGKSGRVVLLSNMNDTEIASYSVWTGIKIHY